MVPVYNRGKAVPAVTATLAVAVILALAIPLAGPAAAAAEQPTPVITTPTPIPTPTPSFAERQQAWLSTPEAERHGGFLFMPLVLKDHRGTPDVTPGSFAYVVKPGDTLWSLALEFGRDLDTMSCATTPTGADAETLTPGQTVTVPALADLCYTVTPDDTLDGIAASHGTTVDAIVAVPWNGFTEPPFVIVPRQRVLLPDARPAVRPRPERSTVSQPSDSWALSNYRNWPYRRRALHLAGRRADLAVRPRRAHGAGHRRSRGHAGEGGRPRHRDHGRLERRRLRVPRGH